MAHMTDMRFFMVSKLTVAIEGLTQFSHSWLDWTLLCSNLQVDLKTVRRKTFFNLFCGIFEVGARHSPLLHSFVTNQQLLGPPFLGVGLG